MTAVLYRKTMTHQSNTQRERTERRARFRLKQLVTAAVLTALLTIGLGRFLVMEGYVLEPIRVEPVMQLPELPNGCEAASLAAVLQFYGYSVDKLDLAYGYIPRVDFWEEDGIRYGVDPNEAYPGDPATGIGFYCFAKPLAEGANLYLQQQESTLYAYDITGVTQAGLRQYLSDGVPVIVWITIDGEMPRYSNYEWTDLSTGETILGLANVHCVVLTALGETKCVLADPLDGERVLEKEEFEQMFSAMGCRAVVIHD